ncbi:MAG: outer membrane beta-barrel protein, partial [Pirellulales bacterium]|nr:outer membrane beta-barrel protein [Pirellulales bacterium]
TSDDDVYGSALPQLYGEMAIDRWTLRAGHFFSLMGYERIAAVNNFFYSRSYAFGIEPITHMGALASYRLADGVEITGGITNGWDNGWLDPSEAITGLGKVSVDLTDRAALSYALTFGDLEPGNEVYLHSIVLQWRLSRRWEYVLQSDFLVDTGGAADVRQDYGMNQYLFYKINDCWKIGARIEWLRAESHNTLKYHNDVFETRTGMTFGLHYSPTCNLMIRPELRWDSATGPMANDFNDRHNTYQFAGGLDVILRF